jgi:uncharacterized protein YdeI (YjbR/CyaY-like superfamily)
VGFLNIKPIKMKRFKTVDDYIAGRSQWQDALIKLREILLSTDLEETVKWGSPVYTFNGNNVVGLGAFKSYVGIWFFQGAFLKDEKKKLINAQEGKTKGLRQWRFNAADEIDADLVKGYVFEAIENQKQGKEIKPTRGKALVIPSELESALNQNKALQMQFNELSLSCKREYAEYITEAKREDTKIRRLEKIIPMIMEKAGLNDKYKK